MTDHQHEPSGAITPAVGEAPATPLLPAPASGTVAPDQAGSSASLDGPGGSSGNGANGTDPNGIAPNGAPGNGGSEAPAAATQAQLRRFIKSRPYVPLHELRRRFGLNGSDDDVWPMDVEGRRLFVGLPEREAGLLGELLRQGDVGYQLLLDPASPIIIGVFPMRPVQRP